jgi:hypothetical protein
VEKMTCTDYTPAAAPKNKAAIGTYVLCFNLLFNLRFLGVVRFVTRGGKKHIANQKLHQGSIKIVFWIPLVAKRPKWPKDAIKAIQKIEGERGGNPFFISISIFFPSRQKKYVLLIAYARGAVKKRGDVSK